MLKKRRDNITIAGPVEDMLARWKDENDISVWMCGIIRRWIAGKRLEFVSYADFERWAGTTSWFITTVQGGMYREDEPVSVKPSANVNY